MSTLSIPADVAERLAERAASHGRTPEAEAREILAEALTQSGKVPNNIADAIRAIVEPLGGIELEIPLRHRRFFRHSLRTGGAIGTEARGR